MENKGNSLNEGEHLLPGQGLMSKNKWFVLILQEHDGNLVLYKRKDISGEDDNYEKALWASGTNKSKGHKSFAKELRLQASDGHLVLSGNDDSFLWSTDKYRTRNFNSNVSAILNDDGNLVIRTNTLSVKDVWSTNIYSYWMGTLDDRLTLKDICMPGSHDAGMYTTTNVWAPNLAVTQGKKIKGQLESGIRYFDLRPQYWSSNSGDERFYAYHDLATGPLFIDILDDIEEFFRHNPTETAILGLTSFKDFPLEGKKDFFRLIIKKIGRYLFTPETGLEPYPRVSRLTLSSLRGKIIILMDIGDEQYNKIAEETDWDFSNYFYKSHFNTNIFDKYSDTKYYKTMLTKQMYHFGTFKDDDRLFLLNWTLTPDGGFWGGVKVILNNSPEFALFRASVFAYAKEINPHLTDYNHARDFLFQRNYYGHSVNIINGDYWDLCPEKVMAACREIMSNRTTRRIWYNIRSSATGKMLQMTKGLASDCVLKVEDSNNEPSQLWDKKNFDGEKFRLQNVETGFYLRAKSSKEVEGSLEDSGDKNMLWIEEEIDGKHKHIISKALKDEAKDDRLDVSNDTPYMHKPNNGDFQKWEFCEQPVNWNEHVK